MRGGQVPPHLRLVPPPRTYACPECGVVASWPSHQSWCSRIPATVAANQVMQRQADEVGRALALGRVTRLEAAARMAVLRDRRDAALELIR
jgi:hypothetical protein